eukprot:TRINITY_DN1099_c0_g2_i2.p1 TRINITY_DN1099_c0_g2~~TRINITY_DN1099_c0_g2_i2.p1  ORF type:complete len:376 (+),score=122.84 TRINITY_DN1099_c0_g2_i2:53-1129(+)
MKLLLPVLLCLVAEVRAVDYLWQGMDARWLRREVGFETPHRLGSVANYLMNNQSGWYTNMTLTPGVTGDYSHPETFYTELPSGFTVGEEVVEFEWTDKLDNSTYPSASSFKTKKFTIPQEATALLKGIRLDMHCDPSLQPVDRPCNSEGDWMSYFNISQSCQTPTSCTVAVSLTRGWTPSQGGGKPINAVMSYKAYVPVMTLIGMDHTAHAETPLVKSGTTTTNRVDEETTYLNVPLDSSAFVGIREVAFQLFETNGQKNLGRYLERFAFHVGPFSRVWPSTTLEMNYKLGVTAAETTTYPSKFTATMVPAVVSWKTPNGMFPIPQKKVEGTVCQSGIGFSCRDHFLKESDNDLVPLK